MQEAYRHQQDRELKEAEYRLKKLREEELSRKTQISEDVGQRVRDFEQ